MDKDRVFKAAQRIAALFVEHASGIPGVWFEDLRTDGPNSFYRRTDGGLFVEFYYSGPASVWTPWGDFKFRGSCAGDLTGVWEKMLRSMTVAEYQSRVYTRDGVLGPVYRVLTVDDVTLPSDSVVLPMATDEEYDRAKAEWEALARTYHQ